MVPNVRFRPKALSYIYPITLKIVPIHDYAAKIESHSEHNFRVFSIARSWRLLDLGDRCYCVDDAGELGQNSTTHKLNAAPRDAA